MYTKNNLDTYKITGKDSKSIRAIAFYPNRTIATDGHRLVEVRENNTERTEDAPTLLEGSLLKAVKLKKNETTTLEDLTAKIVPIAEQYPDADKILRRADEEEYSARVQVNATYLAEIANLLKNYDKHSIVTLKIPTSPHRPVVLEAKGETQTATALLMPII